MEACRSPLVSSLARIYFSEMHKRTLIKLHNRLLLNTSSLFSCTWICMEGLAKEDSWIPEVNRELHSQRAQQTWSFLFWSTRAQKLQTWPVHQKGAWKILWAKNANGASFSCNCTDIKSGNSTEQPQIHIYRGCQNWNKTKSLMGTKGGKSKKNIQYRRYDYI